jgi:tetratricopeptide (TPR) repeat protein
MNRSPFALALILGVLATGLIAPDTPGSAEPIQLGELPIQNAPGSDRRKRELNDALGRFQQGDVDGALARLNDLTRDDPELPPARVILAQFQASANQAAAMRSSLEQAVAETPSDPEAYLILGDLATREGRLTEAGLLCAQADKLVAALSAANPRKQSLDRRAKLGLAWVAEARHDWQAAHGYLDALANSEPGNTGILQRLGQALFHLEKRDEALAKLKAAAEADQNALAAEVLMALLHQEAGDTERAAALMNQAVEANPEDFKTHLAAAQWAMNAQRLDEAARYADAAVTLAPDSIEAKLLRGTIALFSGDYQAAESDLEAVHLYTPANFAAANNLALALCEQNDESKKRRALEYAQINGRQYPKQKEALSTLGWVLYKSGQLDNAESVLREAAAGAGPSGDTAYYLARVLIDRGRGAEAKPLLSTALKTKLSFLYREDAENQLKKLSQ